MPILCVFVDLHNINLLLFKSTTEHWFEVYPYVYSPSLFSASFSNEEFYTNLFKNFCQNHDVNINDCEIAVTGFLEAPVVTIPDINTNKTGLNVKLSKSLLEVVSSVSGYYPVVVNNHSIFSKDFCYSVASVRPIKNALEHLDIDEENFYANLELYPQVISNEVSVQVDIDTNLAMLLNREYDNYQTSQAKKHAKNLEDIERFPSLPRDIPIVFGGARFSQRTFFKELDYLLMLSFFHNAGVYETKRDDQNKVILIALLKMYDPKIEFSYEDLNMPNEATIINSRSPIECVISTDQGTSQLLQLEKNRLLVVPTSSENRVHLSIKSKDLGAIERVVNGSNIGLVFDTRDAKSINAQDIKIFSMGLRNLRGVSHASIGSLI